MTKKEPCLVTFFSSRTYSLFYELIAYFSDVISSNV